MLVQIQDFRELVSYNKASASTYLVSVRLCLCLCVAPCHVSLARSMPRARMPLLAYTHTCVYQRTCVYVCAGICKGVPMRVYVNVYSCWTAAALL